MKKADIIFWVIVLAIFLPFFVCPSVYEWYKQFNAEHGMIMSFFKFAILSTLGEMIGLRISKGEYYNKNFGLIPRMLVWGVLGVFISGAMFVFSHGIPQFMEYMGMNGASTLLETPELSWGKVAVALAVSVAMNSFFAPVFMTFHKITDTHIGQYGGSLSALLHPIKMREIISNLNWSAQWGFVFKKTIPLFWYPAHTITFLLPSEFRVLFAALLGVVLGVLLAIAAKK